MAKKTPNTDAYYYVHEFNELEQLRLILVEIDKLSAKDTKTNPRKSPNRRSKLGLYSDILLAIQEESYGGEVKPTRIQFRSRMAYDKMRKYLNDLIKKGMIENNPLRVTDKGRQFLHDYDGVKEKIEKISNAFL